MGVRDALLLNLTGSNFQALQTDDTARVKGDFSLQKDDGTEVVKFDVSNASIQTINLTGSANLSSSINSTASFTRISADAFSGDGIAIRDTLPRSTGILTSSAQIAADISGAFAAGFEMSSSISGSATSTGSFGRMEGEQFFGDGTNIKTTLPRSTGILTSSKQIASDISGSFNKGFDLTKVVLTSSFYTGVSGSTFHGLGAISSSQFGSDFTHILQELNEKSGVKGKVTNGVWSTGGSMIQGKYEHGGFGDQNFSFAFGGRHTPSFPSTMACNEEYNGSTWTVASALTQATSYNRGVGTGFAGISFGGTTSNDEWNGLSWSETEAAPGPTGNGGASGTQNAANAMGANVPSEVGLLQYNGTNFSEGPTMSVHNSKYHFGGLGTQDATIIMGGIPAPQNCTEHFDGTSWFAGGALNTGRRAMNGGAGGENHAMIAGGMTPSTQNKTEYYDGTTWSEGTNLPSSVRSNHTNGTQGLGLSFGGFPGVGTTYESVGESNTSASFGRLEFTNISGDGTNLRSTLPYSPGLLSSSAQISADISGSFNRGFNFGQTNEDIFTGISGSVSASLGKESGSYFGSDYNRHLADQIGHIRAGGVSGSRASVERIGGVIGGSWSTVGTLNQPRHTISEGMTGETNAAIIAGSGPNEYAQTTCTEVWDGVTWTEVNDRNDATRDNTLMGSKYAALALGGCQVWTHKAFAEEWNGHSWSEIANMPTISGSIIGFGTQNDAVLMEDRDSNTIINYNGTNYSTNPATSIHAGTGTSFGHDGSSNDGIITKGYSNAVPNDVYFWNGSSVSRGPDYNTGRTCHVTWGRTNSALIANGVTPAQSSATEIFDGTTWTETTNTPEGGGGGGSAGTSAASGIFQQFPGDTFQWTGVYNTTASFGRIEGGILRGDASGIQSSLPYNGVVSGSEQLSGDISGSFNKGFEFSGTVKTKTAGWTTTWYTGHDLNTGRSGLGGKGGPNAAIAVAGVRNYDAPQAGTISSFYTGNAGVAVGCTEEWNGISWTEVNDATDAGATGYGGTTEAGYAMGKFHPLSNNTEEWNGTNWSEGPAIDAGPGGRRADSGGCAPNTMYIIGGYTPGGVPYFTTFNGTNFTAEPNMPSVAQNVRNFHAGNSPSAIAAGGAGGGCCTNVWNGSSWSEVGALPFKAEGNTGAGTVNDAYSYGGNRSNAPSSPGPVAGCTDTFIAWDGTSWSEITAGTPIPTYAPYASVRSAIGTGTGASEVFVFGGKNMRSPSVYEFAATSASLQFDAFDANLSVGLLNFISASGDATSLRSSLYPGLVSGSGNIDSDISGSFNKGFNFSGEIKVKPGGAWSTGGNLTRTTYLKSAGIAGTGTKNAALLAGGRGATETEEYDGTSYTEKNDLNDDKFLGVMTGTTEASIIFGGSNTHAVAGTSGCTEEWNGTNWTEVNDMTQARWRHQKLGTTSEAALAVGGEKASPTTTISTTEDWNGTNWSEGTALPQILGYGVGFGAYDSGIVVGWTGTETYCWNGSSWSDVATRSIQRYNTPGGFGTSNNGLLAGGRSPTHPSPGYTDCVELFDGSSWSSGPDIPTGRECLASADSLNTGTDNGMIAAGVQGSPSSYLGETLEYSDNIISASFGRLDAIEFHGDATGLQSSLPYPSGILSSSAQIASDISGSFLKGFSYDGQISGSLTRLEYPVINAGNLMSDASQFTASLFEGIISGAAQVASDISGAMSHNLNENMKYKINEKNRIHAGGVFQSFQAGASGHGTWKTITSANTPRGASRLAGTQNSALLMGGDCVTTNGGVCVEAWDGSAWQHKQGIYDHDNTGYSAGGGYGSQNSAMLTAGRPNLVSDTIQYNGMTWSEVNNFNQARGRYAHSGCTQDDGIMTGGLGASNSDLYSNTEIWDGTTWTEKTDPIRGNGHGHVGGGSSNAFIMGGSQDSPTTNLTEEWNGSSWIAQPNNLYNYTSRGQQGDGSIYNFVHFGGTNSTSPRLDSVEHFDGVGWRTGPDMVAEVGGAFNDGAGRGFGSGLGEAGGITVGGANPPSSNYSSNAQIYEQVSNSTGSFGTMRGYGESTLKTNEFVTSGSTFKLPLFSDKDINYHASEGQESTGSLSGSFERLADKDIFTRPGNFFFHSDYNALGFTYQSSSVYSQSLDFTTTYHGSASVATASTGFITQSHYRYRTMVRYITGSYV